jgi:hypothetical protein
MVDNVMRRVLLLICVTLNSVALMGSPNGYIAG